MVRVYYADFIIFSHILHADVTFCYQSVTVTADGLIEHVLYNYGDRDGIATSNNVFIRKICNEPGIYCHVFLDLKNNKLFYNLLKVHNIFLVPAQK